MIFFKELTISNSVPVCYNLLPHYAPAGQDYTTLTKCVDEALEDGRIRTFFLSDHPAHHQGFSSLSLAEDILAAGGEPLVSLSLTFNDRNALFERLRQYYQAGVRQFLFVSGDYPARSSNKQQQAIFDIDSVQLLMLLKQRQEFENIAKGCVVSPFKSLESEQIWQYEKLRRKTSMGADFIITQLGYDIRKFDELVRFCAMQQITIPLVANIFITDLQTAGMIQAKAFPGIKIPGSLLHVLHEEQQYPQRAIARAAKTLVVLRGLGFNGALLGSPSADFTKIKQVLDQTEAPLPHWRELLDSLKFTGSKSPFYYFQYNPHNGLNSNEPAPVALKHFPSLLYSFSYFVDWLVYVPQGPFFKITGRFCHFAHNKKAWYTVLWLLEYISKGVLYGCNMCGDCTLYACGFLCYQSGCPKKMLNGPCGGSIEGFCEVFPEKKRCFWVKVYHHMKGVRQHVTFVAPPIPARNTKLGRSSSWINFFQGKDHRQLLFEDD